MNERLKDQDFKSENLTNNVASKKSKKVKSPDFKELTKNPFNEKNLHSSKFVLILLCFCY